MDGSRSTLPAWLVNSVMRIHRDNMAAMVEAQPKSASNSWAAFGSPFPTEEVRVADNELLALIQAMHQSRRETNTALGRLTPRNARRIADPLRAERMATSRLVAVLLSEVEETRAFLERIDKAELILDKSPNGS
jgi:hypothetical protein